jgi:hypothetical protein
MSHTEVLVFGATSAGVCAAVAGAEHGAQVTLVGPELHVGGMTSGGLGYTDVGDLRALGGLAARFRRDVARFYDVPIGRYAGPEPHVAERIFERWLDDAGVDVRLGESLAGVDRADGRVRSMRFESGLVISAGVLVDASYEGDLMAAAGVPFRVGREDRGLHGERHAGRQELVPGMHAMPGWISPFAGDPAGEVEGPLLAQVKPEPFAPVGSGDGGVMSYGYRLCLSTAADRVPFDRPDEYDDAYWELARRLLQEWRRTGVEPTAGRMIGLEPNLPGGKADGNSLGPMSLSVLDGSAWRYPTAANDERDRIRRHHARHARGFLFFLANDPAVPRTVRQEMRRWGLAADEFADTGHLPHQLYVREARRMIGERVLTEQDLLTPEPGASTVALGSYHIDIREVQRGWRWVYEHPRPRGMVFTEGYLSVPVPVYPIPYETLLPRREDCTNLLVPVCLSASHVAFASIRMEPQYQMLGHAAGVAAALATRSGTALHDLPRSALSAELRRDEVVLDLPSHPGTGLTRP